ncbi:MAG TPA: alanine racemase [Clostridiales bacterium]|nr:alanine racemase [Clostridiales bacterium]
MANPQKRSWAEISLGNIEHNYRSIRSRLSPSCRFMGVVKANAYGHGAVEVSGLLEKLGCEYLGVATFDEAKELRDADIGLPILILGYTPPCLAPELVRMDITQTVADLETAREMSGVLSGGRLKIHIKLETGMGRIGFPCASSKNLEELLELLALPCFEAEGVFTHFAVSDVFGDSFTREQFKRFTETVNQLEKASGHAFIIKHCANSGAVINYLETHLDMVRPGLALYGMYPGPEKGSLDLRPAMSLKTRVAAVYEHAPGDTISYGRTFTVDKDMRVAVLPIGYADGLHRVASNKIDVLIRGKRARQLGRICMDMCMVDVTDIPDCRPGDVATIFGRNEDACLPVEELAEKSGTINYEIVCSPSRRIPRIYVD